MNETTRPSPAFLEELRKTHKNLYNKGITDALQIVKETYIGFDGDVMLKGDYTNGVFQSMIKQIKELGK